MSKYNNTISALNNAAPYIKLYKDKIFIIKIGGELLRDISSARKLLKQIATIHQFGIKVILVHGGGPQLTEMIEKSGQVSEFNNGRRVTDQSTISLAVMVLNGEVNTKLLAISVELGIPAIGISGIDGGMIVTKKREKIKDETGDLIDYGYVGDISSVNMDILNTQLDAGYIPIISSLTANADGVILNVNADTIAATIAYELSAEKLILMTSVPGILMDTNDKTSLISYINHDSLKKMKSNGKLTDGMLPKVDAIGLALDNGVSRVHIISSNSEDSLLTEIFTNHGTGTLIVKDLTNLTTKEQLGESNEATVG
ncbi:MAG: acetylglutamate kinase [Woeseiaceae bacterium]|nr:acetylglutamate kinase [Woeseiaceae bacterium]